MKDYTENVALIDSDKKKTADFICGVEFQTRMKWEPLIYTSNGIRANTIANAIRYIKYFLFPLKIFLKRKRYKNIIAWQAFYGVLFAFYCQIFHVKKVNTLVITNLVYKPKKGFVGKIYFSFLKYVVNGKYIDKIISASETNCNYCAAVFNADRSKFVFGPFGVNDYSKMFIDSIPPKNDYVLSIGRSNRDWDILIKAFENTDYQLRIVCDELQVNDLPDNIKIYNNIFGDKSFQFMYDCKCMIISIMDGEIASGDTVLLQAMSLSKPVIITAPSCLADDYVSNGETGLVVNKKEADLINAVDRLFSDTDMYNKLTINCRKLYEEKYSLYSYGCRVGELFNV